MSSRFRWLLATIILLLGMLSVFSLVNNDEAQKRHTSATGGDFILQSADGPVALKDYRGKVVILYFGYTYCPDICPTSLGLLTLALNELSKTELQQLQPLFISVDPERDTVEKLKTYASAFHPAIIGLTGSPVTLASVAHDYGVMYMKVEMANSAMGYAIDHSSVYYLVGRDGLLKRTILHGTDPSELAQIIKAELRR